MFRIKFNKRACRGCGACTVCDNWSLGSDGKAIPKKMEVDDIGCNQEAADFCPINVIKIVRC